MTNFGRNVKLYIVTGNSQGIADHSEYKMGTLVYGTYEEIEYCVNKMICLLTSIWIM